MNRATTSLPVPDSPVSSTVVSVAATCVAFFSTSLPLGGLADDARRAGFRLELLGERSARATRAARRVACASADLARRVGQLLVRHRERDVIGDAARHRHVASVERAADASTRTRDPSPGRAPG